MHKILTTLALATHLSTSTAGEIDVAPPSGSDQIGINIAKTLQDECANKVSIALLNCRLQLPSGTQEERDFRKKIGQRRVEFNAFLSSSFLPVEVVDGPKQRVSQPNVVPITVDNPAIRITGLPDGIQAKIGVQKIEVGVRWNF